MAGIDTGAFIATLGVNRAAREAWGYFAVSGLYLAASLVLPWMPWALAAMALVLFLMGCWRLRPALLQRRFEAQLIGDRRPWLTMDELIVLSTRADRAAARWLGYGFAWDAEHCQNVQNLVKTSWKEPYRVSLTRAAARRWMLAHPLQVLLHPFSTYAFLKTKKALAATTPGFRWIHALGEEQSTFVSRKELEGHMAVFGTTGSGKSRFLEVQIAQAILQGHCVIVLDPKGDKGLENSMRLACRRAGRSDDYLQFLLAQPEASVNIDLLANYIRADEVASRIADTLPGQGGEGQVFVDMARGGVRSICDGLGILGKKPTLKGLLHYYVNREGLALAALSAYLAKVTDVETVRTMTGKAKNPEALLEDMREFYLSQGHPSAAVDSVLGLVDLDGALLSKMTQSLAVVLGSLTRGDIGSKLSPDGNRSPVGDQWWDTKKVMEHGCVLYVGLDAMTDSGMARVIGTLFLSDLT
ncbi:MAG: helicase HerA domain-containing protein, partial [Duodenibacillus sp.]